MFRMSGRDKRRKATEVMVQKMGGGLRRIGIPQLDRKLGNGLPAGSMILIASDPFSMTEIFLYQFAQTRPTYYFTTDRRPDYIYRDIENLDFDTSNITFVDVYSEYFLTPHGEMADNIGNQYLDLKIIDFSEYNLKKIRGEYESDVNIIIDSFSFYMNLQVNPGRIKKFINYIYEITKDTKGLTFLHYHKEQQTSSIENDIKKASDVIFDIKVELSENKILNKLYVPKIRGKIPPTDVIRYKITERGIQIDTAKDIA